MGLLERGVDEWDPGDEVLMGLSRALDWPEDAIHELLGIRPGKRLTIDVATPDEVSPALRDALQRALAQAMPVIIAGVTHAMGHHGAEVSGSDFSWQEPTVAVWSDEMIEAFVSRVRELDSPAESFSFVVHHRLPDGSGHGEEYVVLTRTQLNLLEMSASGVTLQPIATSPVDQEAIEAMQEEGG